MNCVLIPRFNVFCLILVLPISACGQHVSPGVPSSLPSITLIKESHPIKPELIVAWYQGLQKECIEMWASIGKPIVGATIIPSQDLLNVMITREEEYFQGSQYAYYKKEITVGKLDGNNCKYLPPLQHEEIQIIRGCEVINIDVTNREMDIGPAGIPHCVYGGAIKDNSPKLSKRESTIAGQICAYGDVPAQIESAAGSQCYLKLWPYYAPVDKPVLLKSDYSNSEMEKTVNKQANFGSRSGLSLYNTIVTQVKIGEPIPREKFYADAGRESYKPSGAGVRSDDLSDDSEAQRGDMHGKPQPKDAPLKGLKK
jgi:hypothetical protein